MKGKDHVLRDALSRASHSNSENNLYIGDSTRQEFHDIELPTRFLKNYNQNQMFGPIYSALHGTLPPEGVHKERVMRSLLSFSVRSKMLLYGGMVCIPRVSLRDNLYLARGCKVSGHFLIKKYLSRIQVFNWKNKPNDSETCCFGCATCQLNKDSRKEPLRTHNRRKLPIDAGDQ